MQKRNFVLGLLSAGLVLAAVGGGLLTGCSSTPPTVVINSPANGTQVNAGQDVPVQSLATDPGGILRVELNVDGVIVATSEAPSPQLSFLVVHTWKAAGAGAHKLVVSAYNKDGKRLDSGAVQITVNAQATPAGQPTPAVQPTPASQPTIAPTSAPTGAPPTAVPTAVPTAAPTAVPCVNNATFVADVTVPDGSQFQPGQQFTKVWRIKNAGNCAWGTNFQFVFVGGESMSNIQGVAVPNVAPNSTADFSIPMVAPGVAGAHSGSWRMRDGAGNLFGIEVSVKINVVLPQPTACTPQISSFSADRATINRGESTVLRWGTVTNADRAEIDNGIGGVATPGDRVVAPNQTTVFTLYAYCGGNRVSRSVTIYVNQPQQPTSTSVPPTAVPPTAVPQRRNISGSWSAGNHGLELQEALGCGGPSCGVTGSYSEWTGGTPKTATVNGTVNVNTGAVSLTIVEAMPGAPVMTFSGTLSSNSNSLSGNLSGVGQLTFARQ